MENGSNYSNGELNKPNEVKSTKKSVNKSMFVILLFIIFFVCGYFIFKKDKSNVDGEFELQNNKYLAYRLSGNSLENFDLYFLQLENNKKNKIYSPLSIKYALEMLEEAANGNSKKEISNIIGTYRYKKYTNSENMSFANALFIKDSYKKAIKESYINNLSSKFNAEVVYDSFATPNTLNSWISNKTFNLIDNIADDISEQDFILVNALALDMEWNNVIQDVGGDYRVNYNHQKFSKSIGPLEMGYHKLKFEDSSYDVKSVELGAVVNKYDIVNVLGEDTIRQTVGNEYSKWLASGGCYGIENEPDVNTYLDKYIKEINENYKDISSSTDFEFYVDDNVKVFAKDLKKYDSTILQYVAIMPKNDSLDNYIANINAANMNTLINNLKPIELNSFKDGVITEISGYIPMFKFDYELNLMDDLSKLGITSVFNRDKADLSNLANDKIFIDEVSHKANIEFSNEGIKAGAVTIIEGGRGAGGCSFDYIYDVPVEKIDLTFDKPYLFLIRDKKSGEVWFVGTVYEPTEYQKQWFDEW